MKTMVMVFELPTPIAGFLIGMLLFSALQTIYSLLLYFYDSKATMIGKAVWKYSMVYGLLMSFTATMIEYSK